MITFLSSCSPGTGFLPEEYDDSHSRYYTKYGALCSYIEDFIHVSRKTDIHFSMQKENHEICYPYAYLDQNLVSLETKESDVLYYVDQDCNRTIEYFYYPFIEYCLSDIMPNNLSIDHNNPNKWSYNSLDLKLFEKTKTYSTKWTESPVSQLNISATPPINKKQVFVKKVEYGMVDGCALEMSIFKTNIHEQNLKPLMLIHGGGWFSKDGIAKLSNDILAINLANKGFVVFSPTYRLIGELSKDNAAKECSNKEPQDLIADILYAKDWITNNAQDYGVKKDYKQSKKVYLAGQSAGAHISAFLITYYPEFIQKALLLYPITDFSFILDHAQTFYKELYDNPNNVGRLSISNYLDINLINDISLSDPLVVQNSFPQYIQNSKKEFPDVWLVHGAADDIVPPATSLRFCNALSGQALTTTQIKNDDFIVSSCSKNNKSKVFIVPQSRHILDMGCFNSIIDQSFLLEQAISFVININNDPATVSNYLCPVASEKNVEFVSNLLETIYEEFATDRSNNLKDVDY